MLKQSLNIQKKLEELEIMSQNTMIFVGKNVDFSRTQGVCHVIHIFFGSSLGKI